MKAEDLTYRLQVLITKSKKHANRCRRKILLSEDVDQCLEEFGESPLLAAKEPETGVIAYDSNPLYYHIPQAINLENLSLEDGPAMIFSPLKLEKFPILVDGKPTKFVKEKFTSFLINNSWTFKNFQRNRQKRSRRNRVIILASGTCI